MSRGRIEDLLADWREADRALARASASREAGEMAARAAKQAAGTAARTAEAADATATAAREAVKSADAARDAARETAETAKLVMEASAHDLESMLATEESAKTAEAEAGTRYREAAGGRPCERYAREARGEPAD